MKISEARRYLSEEELPLFPYRDIRVERAVVELARTRKELWKRQFCLYPHEWLDGRSVKRHSPDCIFHDMPGKDAKR